MIYLPDAFREMRVGQLHALIDANGFATLISPDHDDPLVTHLPLLLDRDRGAHGTLVGHFARGNPHWRRLEERAQVLAIFHGPHSYISPSWYGDHPSVPTWNYAVVHARGAARLLHHPDALEAIVRRLVATYEGSRPAPWRMELPEDYQRRMLSGIVGFEIEIASLIGKFKLSQNRSSEDQHRVAAALQQGSPPEQETAALMRSVVLAQGESL